MAERYKRYERQKRRTKAPLASMQKETKPKVELAKSEEVKQDVENIKKRLEGSGVDVEKVTDKRNFVEKGLNLEEDQNVIFDIFEVMGRPQQFIFGGIKSMQEGKGFMDGAMAGLTGEEFTNFSDILNEAGMGDDSSFGLDDVLGFVGDVILDPVDLAIFAGGVIAAPATGGTSVVGATGAIAAKGARTADKIYDAAKAVDKAKDIVNKFKAGAKATGTLYGDIGKGVKGGLGKVVKGEFKDGFRAIGGSTKKLTAKTVTLSNGTKLSKISPMEIAMKPLFGGLKVGAATTNATIKTALSMGSDAAKISERLGSYEDMLKSIEGAFNRFHKMGHDFKMETKAWLAQKPKGQLYGTAAKDYALHRMHDFAEGYHKQLAEEAAARGEEFTKTIEDVTKEVDAAIALEIELKYSPEISINEMLNSPHKFALPLDETNAEAVRTIINHPAFGRINRNFGTMESLKRSKLAISGEAKAVNDMKRKLIQDYRTERGLLNEEIVKLKEQLAENARKAGVEVSPGEQAVDFIEGLKNGKSVDELMAAPNVKNVPGAPKTPGEEAEDFIKGLQEGKNVDELMAGGTIKVDDATQAKITELEAKIAKVDENIEFVKKSKMNQIEGHLNQLEASGKMTSEQVTKYKNNMAQYKDAIKKESYNLFDKLYYKAYLENGQAVWRLRPDVDVDNIIGEIMDEMKQISRILTDDAIDTLKIAKSFHPGDSMTEAIKDLMKRLNVSDLGTGTKLSGKTFDDLFELDNKLYRIKDQEAVDELMRLARPNEQLMELRKAPVYRTEQELQELAARFDGNHPTAQLAQEMGDFMKAQMQEVDNVFGTHMFKDTEGFVHHAIIEEQQDLMRLEHRYRTFKDGKMVMEDNPHLLGNAKVFSSRKYNMSIAEANLLSKDNAKLMLSMNDSGMIKMTPEELSWWGDKANLDLFSEYFTDSFADGLIKMNAYGSAVRVMDKALVASHFADNDVIRKIPPTAKVTDSPPAGFVKVSKGELNQKIQNMTNFYDDNGEMFKFMRDMQENYGNNIYMDKNTFDIIGRLGNKAEVNKLVKMIDATNNFYKRTKLLSLGFHTKNLMGNAANLYLSGVNPLEIPRLLAKGLRSEKLGKALLEDFVASGKSVEAFMQTLDPKKAKIFKTYNIFLNGGFENAGSTLFDLDQILGDAHKANTHNWKSVKKKFAEAKGVPAKVGGSMSEAMLAIVHKNGQLNGVVDSGYRLGYIRKLIEEGYEETDIIAKVTDALFDPNDLSHFEKTVAKRAMPFYTFAKKNLAFQFKNFYKQPDRYYKFYKGIRSSWDVAGIDWNSEVQDYQKENMFVPIPLSLKEDGSYTQLKTSFPISDFIEFVDNPFEKLMTASNPFVKGAYEIQANKNMFTGRDIEEFEGQKGENLPFLSAKQEHMVGVTGMDRPIAAVKSVFDLVKTGEVAKGMPTVVSQSSTEKAAKSKAYDELFELRDLMKYYKAYDVPIKTIAEIENINKPKANLASRLSQIQRKRK